MSDRRAAMVTAIRPVLNAALDDRYGGRWDSPAWTNWENKIAEAALDAIDALLSDATAKAAYDADAARYDIDMRWDELSDRERAGRRAEHAAPCPASSADDPPVAIVARAIRTAFTRIGGHQPGETFDEWAARMDRALALSAMAAMRAIPWPGHSSDIEPTEAELDATQRRWDAAFEEICKLPNDQLPDDPFRESLRAALTYFVAARKAGC